MGMPLKLLFPSITLEMKPVYRLNHPINQNQAICARKGSNLQRPPKPQAPCAMCSLDSNRCAHLRQVSHSKSCSLFFHVSAIVYDRGYLGPKSDHLKWNSCSANATELTFGSDMCRLSFWLVKLFLNVL